MVSSAGGRKGFVYSSRHRAYRAVRATGASKEKSARIANAGRTKGGTFANGQESRTHQKAEGSVMAKIGFKKLSGQLRRKGVRNPDALAAHIGRKKYGKAGMAKKAAAGRKRKNK